VSSAISSLLVRDQVVAVRLVEEALERQVLYGGDLETNLLELRAAHEEVLAEYRARAAGMPVAGRRDLALAAPDAVRILSREHAERHRIVPIRFDGRQLVVAASQPPPPAAIEELSFLLSAEIAPHVAMEHRLAWALLRYYGIALPPRMKRLLDRIAAEDEEARALDAMEAPVLVTHGVSVAPAAPARAPEPPPMVIEPIAPAPGEPTQRFGGEAPARATLKTVVEFPAMSEPYRPPSRPAFATQLGLAVPHLPDEAPSVSAPAAEGTSSGTEVRRSPSGSVRITLPPPESATPVELPESFAERIAIAATRDEVIDALIAAGRYLFEYVAIFAVHDGALDGKRSDGRGAPTGVVQGIHVPIGQPSAFGSAAETRSVFIGPPSTAVDAETLAALGRRAPTAMCLVPIGMRGRTVLLLYADAGDRPASSAAARELSSLAPRAAMALERVIMARKIADRANRKSAPSIEPAVAPPPPEPVAVEPPAAPPDVDEGRPTIPMPAPDFDYEEISVTDVDADDAELWEEDEEAPGEEAEDDLGEREIDAEQAAGDPSLRGEIDRLLRGYVEEAPPAPLRRPKRIRSKQQTLTEVGRPAALQQPVSGISGRKGPEAPRPSDPEGPSVIFEVGDNVERLVQSLYGTAEEADLAAAALQKLGEAAMPAVVRRFPGPLSFDRVTARGPLPRAADCGPMLRLLVAERRIALPYVKPLFESHDPDVRFYAVLLAREYQAPDAVPHLARRVFDEDYGVRTLATDTMRLHKRFAEFDGAVRDLRAWAADDRMPRDTRLRAVEALAGLLDVGSVRLFVAILESPQPDLREAALRGLTAVTCQNFGAAPRKWAAWLDKNGGRHRIEWLIDALVHAEAEIRLAASDELKRITKEYFGYYYNLPKRDRDRARKRYLEWWDRVGKQRFGQGS